MLTRTFSFWRRLVGRPELVTAEAGPTESDRRVWVRHPANLETTFQPAGAGDANRFSARVRDISRGGVHVLVNRAFQPGDLLSIELPVSGDQGPVNVLACIVRVTAQGQGEWALGCVFSRELDEEDLLGFGAKRQKHSPRDQRTWMRFPCNVTACFQQVGGSDSQTYAAQVLNMSANGVGLLVDAPIETGSLLSVDLAPASGAAGRTMLACVVHAAQKGPGQWALGCNFIHELGEEDLEALKK